MASASTNIDIRRNMPRNESIDSQASSNGMANMASFTRAQASLLPNRTSAEVPPPEDVAAYIASAGSAETAVMKALTEKNSAAAHNAQLWRLVEKQRAMIIDLNRNLEKAMKEKERYRKKIKDHLISSSSAPSMIRLSEVFDRDHSQSPVMDESAKTVAHPAIRDGSTASRKVSDTSDAASSAGLRRSDTPQDAAVMSSAALPATPQSDQGSTPQVVSKASTVPLPPPHMSTTPPLSPEYAEEDNTKTPQPSKAVPPVAVAAVATAATAAATGVAAAAAADTAYSTTAPTKTPLPKAATRKAPPAPLELSPRAIQPLISRALASESDSEYDEDQTRERAITRGRRKTREDDDREREAIVRQEQEARSKSKKTGASKSKSTPRSESVQPEDFPVSTSTAASEAVKAAQLQDMSQPSIMLRQRGMNDSQGILQRNITAPALMSPGLPMSPRPGDRPMNSPMPRAPNKAVNSIPMSPRAGLPLSPRPPKQALPMPPQTPLAFTSPHLARAEQYHQTTQMPSQVPPRPSSEVLSNTGGSIRASAAIDSRGSIDVFRGLATDQYPDLLLPPNALPSVNVQVVSSVLRRSRQSAVAVSQQLSEEPVVIVGVFQRSDGRQLWRIEKTIQSLAILDLQLKASSNMSLRFPDKSLFVGAAPARVDARRHALNYYFDQILDSIQDERTAKVFCKYLSTDTLAAETPETMGLSEPSPGVPGSSMNQGRLRREGYLTKKGKNFGGWKARYFILEGSLLKYFEGPGGAQLGTIKLQNAQIGKQAPNNSGKDQSEDEDNQFRHAFLILEPKKKDSSSLVRHVLCAESDEERDSWVDALLQHVDFRDAADGHSAVNGSKAQKSNKVSGDFRPISHAEAQQLRAQESMRYDQMVAGDAPTMGATGGRTGTTPPPRYEESHAFNISGPSNAQPIQNSGEWGNKPPGTPNTLSKDKKRGLFGFRGRSSSDLAPSAATPGFAPEHSSFARAVFGVPLVEAISYAQPAGIHTDLPAVVYRCIEYLEHNNASSEEGIFRLSGSNTTIKALRERFNTEGDVNLVEDGQYYDMHAIASLLKLYLRELPASILTRELHLDFLKCMELQEQDMISALNVMVNRLPQANRALLETLSAFLLSIVNNADVNKMNVRNVGIVFAPTLNVPGPLISAFVEDQRAIFGEPVVEAESPIAKESSHQQHQPLPTDLRSPRKQMFSDLPTPAYNQTQFSPLTAMPGNPYATNDTGMIPVHPTYQMAPQGDGAFGSLNDALRSPGLQGFNAGSSGGLSVPKDAKNKRRESSLLGLHQSTSSGQSSGTGSNSIGKKGSGLSGVGDDRYGRF